MHLRKAKLMFFWVRYPSSAVLKMYFPDIKFNKNNTAQLVKWFSNFRPNDSMFLVGLEWPTAKLRVIHSRLPLPILQNPHQWSIREFYYIQMEKYARQAVSEGVKNADDLHVSADSEIYRVLNLHYNRNNHIEVWGPQVDTELRSATTRPTLGKGIELHPSASHLTLLQLQVPSNFRYVVEQTLREFFKAIQGGKDTEQSWKKSIYKIISRLDDPVPEYFKSPNFLEQLE
uniref:(California timema) hypothetical protein n=1 Tax=Timema californicum TaxID=61474 RepID=A0A7R9JA89_TIMCA|nr:unnamed protein product [Timema californicum]